MGGPTLARGRGRPRKEATKIAKPPLEAGEHSSPSIKHQPAEEELKSTNPNSQNSVSSQHSPPSRLSWASIVQGPQPLDRPQQGTTVLQASPKQNSRQTMSNNTQRTHLIPSTNKPGTHSQDSPAADCNAPASPVQHPSSFRQAGSLQNQVLNTTVGAK
ncbi:unnamed protein product [Amaranthus hypochondriacus]